MIASPATWTLDPEWTVARRYACGHVTCACCEEHLPTVCDVCPCPHASRDNKGI